MDQQRHLNNAQQSTEGRKLVGLRKPQIGEARAGIPVKVFGTELGVKVVSTPGAEDRPTKPTRLHGTKVTGITALGGKRTKTDNYQLTDY